MTGHGRNRVDRRSWVRKNEERSDVRRTKSSAIKIITSRLDSAFFLAKRSF